MRGPTVGARSAADPSVTGIIAHHDTDEQGRSNEMSHRLADRNRTMLSDTTGSGAKLEALRSQNVQRKTSRQDLQEVFDALARDREPRKARGASDIDC